MGLRNLVVLFVASTAEAVAAAKAVVALAAVATSLSVCAIAFCEKEIAIITVT